MSNQETVAPYELAQKVHLACIGAQTQDVFEVALSVVCTAADELGISSEVIFHLIRQGRKALRNVNEAEKHERTT